ncbi:MAG: efflux RND transporter permease subunit [Myxococcota bacterium]|nr:efflux RND transporter permease subunit [Myxococcota bacterium]
MRRFGRSGPIAWMAANPVAANLLMLLCIGGGLAMSFQVNQEVFPRFELDEVRISFGYPGASPEEIEQGVLLAAEESVRGLDGVKEVVAAASEGSGIIRVKLLRNADLEQALSDVKGAIDRIRSLPEEVERPVIKLTQARQRSISVLVHGHVEPDALRSYAETLRRALIAETPVTMAEVGGISSREIAIEIKPETLRTYGLTIPQIARFIRQASVELPSGRIRSSSGEILIRTTQRRNLGEEFGDVVIISRPDGTRVRLRDIADVKDTFAEDDQETSLNGEPTISVDAYRVGKQTPNQIAGAVKAFLKVNPPPHGISTTPWDDRSIMFTDRINLLKNNAITGLILVFVVLGLFLELRLSFWVMLGIPISFLGAFLLLPIFDASINMVSMFAFILVLGIVVDDAIVVGENIFQKKRAGMPPLTAAIEGAKEVATPVIFAILTTVAAFGPLLFVPGFSGKIFAVIPIIVIAVLILSLVESLFILPAHLAHVDLDKGGFWAWLSIIPRRISNGLDWFIERVYVPIARFSAQYRYSTTAFALVTLMMVGGVVSGGLIGFSFMPRLQRDVVVGKFRFPVGSTFEQSKKIRDKAVQTAQATIDAFEAQDVIRGVYATAGRSLGGGGGPRTRGSSSGTNIVEVAVALPLMADRTFTGRAFVGQWRKRMANVTGIENRNFSFAFGGGAGSPIDVQLSHPDAKELERAATRLSQELRTFAGVEDIDTGFSDGKAQLDARLTPLGRAAGITEVDLAQQLRAAFFGIEVLRQQRQSDEVKVIVRLPRAARDQIASLENLILRTPTGGEIPLADAAVLTPGRAYASIRRINGARVLNVTAEVERGKGNSNSILGQLRSTLLPSMMADTPGLSYSFEGSFRGRRDSLASLRQNFLFAMIIIYGLLAIPFKSYTQPLLVMSAIPFGFVGAIVGHLIMGFELSIISIMGMVALAGVVVNDSLLLIVTTNRYRADGMPPFEAVIAAGARRFRPILLTSLTTFFGLMPIMSETSVQARFLQPMALSLGAGVLWVTVIVLVFVPAFYLVLEDILNLFYKAAPSDGRMDEDSEPEQPLGNVAQPSA